jgi:hypothetical protein
MHHLAHLKIKEKTALKKKNPKRKKNGKLKKQMNRLW